MESRGTRGIAELANYPNFNDMDYFKIFAINR
jgi:hypothetical protein